MYPYYQIGCPIKRSINRETQSHYQREANNQLFYMIEQDQI